MIDGMKNVLCTTTFAFQNSILLKTVYPDPGNFLFVEDLDPCSDPTLKQVQAINFTVHTVEGLKQGFYNIFKLFH
jgi:hypothetical protein